MNPLILSFITLILSQIFPGPGVKGYGATTVVAQTVTSHCAGGANGATITAFDTTSANGGLAIIGVSFLVGSTIATPTDSVGTNTWVGNTTFTPQNPGLRIYYAKNFTGNASQSFTFTSTGSFSAICVNTFTNASISAPFDVESAGGNNAFATTIQPGSSTPTNDGSVLIVLSGYNSNAVTGIDSGFIRSGTMVPGGGSNFGLDMAYKIQGAKTAENPTYTFTGSMPVDAIMSVYR